jgi:hypothetical protein
MMKRMGWFAAIFVVMGLFIATGLMAGSEVADVFDMKSPEYEKHTKGIVSFSHKKHAADYGAKCGDCHHDDKGQPLDLKEGDAVQRCIECHKETNRPKGKDLKAIKKEDRIKRFHEDAIHANCRGCHKAWNKEKGLKANDPKAAPTTCKNCHPKKKK